MPTSREVAIFEAGIKLGALYHQFVGTPVSLESAELLERAIERSVLSQPFVKSVHVSINKDLIKKSENRFGYCELEGKMLQVELFVEVEGETVRALLEVDETGYPLMRLEE
ncbi:hypothetical protein DRN72_00520 [Methanosarcinales archaeon]|nr:MAG: hypothetical protein DRN72_00520 [Methanosarcinales archaeon]